MKLIFKTIIYRALSFEIQFLLLWFLTSNKNEAFNFSIVIEAGKIIWYYIYELIWRKIK